ncbi:MAG: M23 family metallopeptidase [Candidatus Thiodiazotropha lotti]|nr:M23 family metallopeptidase [Candidatus Thiodiazotropha lotti]
MKLPVVRTSVRGQDNLGSGEFGAPRGSRKHKGIDIVAYPGFEVLSVCHGEVTKIGYPYSQDDLSADHSNEDERRKFYLKKAMRYVEVMTTGRVKVRYFYVTPAVMVGDRIHPGRSLGIVQDIAAIYPGITPHFHFEVLDRSGQVVNPYHFLEDQI